MELRVVCVLGMFLPFLLAGCFAEKPNYVELLLSLKPVAYWRFETMNDQSLVGPFKNAYFGNAKPSDPGLGAPLQGFPTNRALKLDGNGDYVTTGLKHQVDFGDAGTFVAWVNFAELPSSTRRIFAIVGKSEHGNDFDLQAEPDGSIRFYTDSRTSTRWLPKKLVTGQWYHLVASLFVNGELVSHDRNQPPHSPGGDEIAIGECIVFRKRFFSGLIDEVAIFDRALETNEVTALYQASSGQ